MSARAPIRVEGSSAPRLNRLRDRRSSRVHSARLSGLAVETPPQYGFNQGALMSGRAGSNWRRRAALLAGVGAFLVGPGAVQAQSGAHEAAAPLSVAAEIAAVKAAHPDAGEASDALVAVARRRFSEEDLPGARQTLDAAVALAGDAPTPALARALGVRSRLNFEAGDYPAAHADVERALSIRRAGSEPDNAEIATLIYDDARAYDAEGKNEQAEAAALESYELRREHLGQVHEKTADSLNLYANALTAQGRHAEADPAYRQVLGMYEVLYGPKDWHVAIVLSNLGNSLRRTGRGRQANALYRRAVAIAEISGDKVLLAQCLNNYGWYLHTQGDGEKAEAQFRRALPLAVQIVGPEHAFVGVLHANIGSALVDQRKYAEAEPEFARGLALLEKGMGPDSPDLVETLSGYAMTLAGLDRPDEAEVYYRRIRAITDARLAPAHPVALSGADGYAAFLLGRNRPAEALDQLRGSLGQLTARSGGGRDWRTTVRGAGPMFERRVEASWRLATLEQAAGISAPDRSSTP